MTAEERGVPRASITHRRRSRWRARDWRVRTKLAAVLTVPLVGFLVVAGVQIVASVRTASDLDSFAGQVALGREVTALVHEVQRERDRTAGLLASLGTSVTATVPPRDMASLAPEWTAVDRAAERLRVAAQPLLGNEALAQAYGQAQVQLGEMRQVRAGARQGWLRTQATFDMYTRTIAALQALLPAPVEVGGDAALGQVVRGLTNLARAKELTAQIRGQLYVICHTGGFEPGAFERIADARAERQAAIDRFRDDANREQLAQFDDIVTGQAVRNASRLEQTVIGNVAAAELGVDPLQWWSASTTELELMRTVEQGLLESAAAGVAAASGSQWRTTLLGSAASVALLSLALLLSLVIGRTMVSTLRSLREQAMHVAQYRLPRVIEQLRLSPTKAPPLVVDPVAVASRDEIGEVADAFTAVHRSAVRLAAEQANMRRNVNEIFIKLALRSQTLVERQLQLLDTMESAEVDPDQLANLFRLDHLATRLRRNDENLLVLAGGDTSRHWNKPVELNTVVLAATAEIEHYARVHHDVSGTIYVVGYVVADLVNLLAELLENAAAFSPPETTVIVRGQAMADGAAELVISDSGIGMSPDGLAQANEQVSAPVSIDISAAERMGLVVVGHLANRHGISVELSSGEQGVSVYVGIPATLVTPPPPPDDEESGLEPARWLRPGEESTATTDEPVPASRFVPTRAEDVLSPGRHESSIWWSREPVVPTVLATPPKQPEVTAVTDAGLPVRVRMAHLPAEDTEPPVREVPEADPDAIGDMLSRLYSGMRRADAEADQQIKS